MPKPKATNSLRIIGGKWRGRKIATVAIEGLRPTADRVRETLFNWLMPYIQDAVCLDLFAGSGALSFEALSRGASKAIAVEQNLNLVTQLQQTAQQFACDNINIVAANAFEAVLNLPYKVDIIFLDPPFAKGYIAKSLDRIRGLSCLDSQAIIYLETELAEKDLPLTDDWQILKAKKVGMVYSYLIQEA